jgi:ribonuclease HI
MKRIIICTDGSAISARNTTGFDSAGAYVIIKDFQPVQQEVTVLKDHTNNYAEMYAIYKGTKWCLENIRDLSKYDQLLIVTDSQLCQQSLSTWMKGWLKKATNETLINSTGEKVKNQELIKSTYINILLLMQQINVFICHVNSHQPQSKIPQMYEKLNKDFPDMSYDEFVLIYDGNNYCDETARKALN